MLRNTSNIIRAKPEYNSTRNCRFETKADYSELNSQEAVAEKFRAMKEEIRRRRIIGSASHTL